MPAKFDKILEGIKQSLSGKTNPKTKKPYTESEMYAIAQAQYNKTKKSFSAYLPITKGWIETVKNEEGEDSEQRFIKTVVTGTKEDRDGEVMDQEAIDDMIIQFKGGKIPLFPDHGMDDNGNRTYSWKQIMGVWTDAHQEGENVIAVARLNKAHPDSERFWNYLKEGMPVGFSIGAKVIEVENEDVIEE